MVFDPSYPDIDMSDLKTYYWKEFYGPVTEAFPLDAPPSLREEVDLCLYVDSDHTGDKATRHSHTGYYIFINIAPILWFSKRQPTVEASIFVSEFVAMKKGMKALRGLQYKIRMMGIPLSGPSFAYGKNMYMIHNTQHP